MISSISLARSFWKLKLDIVDCLVNFKVAYHNNTEKVVVINTDFKAARHNLEGILTNLLTTLEVLEKGSRIVNMVDFDKHEDKVRLILNGDYKVFQLDDNSIGYIMIGFGLPYRVKNTLIKRP